MDVTAELTDVNAAAGTVPAKPQRRDRREQLLFREAVIAAARDLFVQEGAEGL